MRFSIAARKAPASSPATAEKLRIYKNKGLVGEVFSPRDRLDELKGNMAIGHVRYSTTGSNRIANAQPLLVNYRGGSLAIAHNGNLINAASCAANSKPRRDLPGHRRQRNHRPPDRAGPQRRIPRRPHHVALYRIRGAWSLLFLRERQMVAVKDPRGIRPLCLGTLDGATVIASESCALDIMGAQHLRDVKPGEMIVVGDEGVRHEFPFPPVEERSASSNTSITRAPDSVMHGKSIYQVRVALGERLAQEQPAEADLVIPTPDSSNAAAIGYAKAAGLPFHLGMIRSHYIGRTFIEPDQGIRNFGAKLKYSPVASLLEGKSVVVVDDSIVRGTTSVKIVEMLRRAGARQVHLRISAPPWKHPCFYGIDTPTEKELIANQLSHEAMTKHFGCDTLGFISLEGLLSVVPRTQTYCTACFNGDYPAGKPNHFTKNIMEQTSHKC